ncbi:putative reverse transcriptase domain-containing protein [Tanacetum coccineum]
MQTNALHTSLNTKRAKVTHAKAGNDARGSRPVRGQDVTPVVRECTFAGFMKCNPTIFCGIKGVVELRRWFEKTKSVFGISECVEGKKVKFGSATLQGPALTWWNSKRVKEYNIVSYTKRFNELALMCPRMVEQESVKVDAYIRGLSENIKGKDERILEGKKRKWENFQSGNSSGHKRNRCPKKVKQEETGEVRVRAYAIKDAEPQGPNVVTGTFLLNNRYASILFDSGSNRSFVDTRFSSMLDIDPLKIDASYVVKLTDGRVVSTSTVLKGCTLNLVNYFFEIDLMPIELGMFDVMIGMDWLVKHDAVIIYGEKVIHIPYGNKTLTVKSDKGMSRQKVISCIKARKYIERGCHLFLAHVTEKKLKEK